MRTPSPTPPDHAGPIERCRALFRSVFDADASHEADAPARVNIIGDHTDYNAGLALPMAIDRRTAVCVSCSVGLGCRAVSESAGTPPVTFSIEPDAPPVAGWARYVQGVLVHVGRRLGVGLPGLDIAVASDIPVGAGLSSSAALEVAVARAACSLLGVTIEARGLAELCQRAEHEYARVPCGLMDQLTIADTRAGCALLIDFATLDVWPVDIHADAAFIVVDSGERRELAVGRYADLRQRCEAALAELHRAGRHSFRDATPADADRLSGMLQRAARHVITENARVEQSATALAAGRLDELGELMNQSHASLRDDLRVSTPGVDSIVEQLTAIPVVRGARMTGAGLGGCTVALAHRRDADAVLDEMKNRAMIGPASFQPFIAEPPRP